MGYETEFYGQLKFDKPPDPAHKQYLNDFFRSRRMMRCATKTSNLADPVREAVKLPVGNHGCYYVGSANNDFGQDHDDSVLDYNKPPKDQPSLWCDMYVTDTYIGFSSGKFYNYLDWLSYVIENFIKPWGYKLNGAIEWSGEDRSDMGKITVRDNVVSVSRAKITWEND